MSLRLIIVLPILASWAAAAPGTDRSFDDITAVSPSGEWKVTANSPYNRIRGHSVWQRDFVYSSFRRGGTEPVWMRKQEEQQPYEDSPVRITVADDGAVAILTGEGQVVFIDSSGRNRASIDDFKALISDADREIYGVHSSAGLIWSPNSLWYFLPTDSRQLFVVRLWWGRRIIIDPESGEVVRPSKELAKPAGQVETERTIALLGKYEFDPLPEEDVEDILLGAYLAGVLQIKALVPWLQNLEQSEHVGLTSLRGGSSGEDLVSPFILQCHTARQVARLSLRRLGATTTSLPIYEFKLPGPEEGYLRPLPLAHSIESQFPLVKQGMTVREVLNVVGSPDFVVADGWEYDIAGSSPATPVIEWESGRVRRTSETEARWKEGLARDWHVMLF